MQYTNVEIKTQRLILRPINHSYIDEIYKEFTPEITKYMSPVPSKDINSTIEFIDSAIENMKLNTNLQLVILKRIDSTFVGCAGLHKTNTVNPELGIWIKKSEHGNGYGLEAITELINWTKTNIKYEYLCYPVDKRNYASRRIPEANGGKIGREFKSIKPNGIELDEVEYWIYK